MLVLDVVTLLGESFLDKLTHMQLSFLVNEMFIVYIFINVKHVLFVFTAVLIGLG